MQTSSVYVMMMMMMMILLPKTILILLLSGQFIVRVHPVCYRRAIAVFHAKSVDLGLETWAALSYLARSSKMSRDAFLSEVLYSR